MLSSQCLLVQTRHFKRKIKQLIFFKEERGEVKIKKEEKKKEKSVHTLLLYVSASLVVVYGNCKLNIKIQTHN